MTEPIELSPLQHWMRLASVEEQEMLAQLAGTSREYLYQIGSGHRACSADLASRIERAASKINSRSARSAVLPAVLRTSLAKACGACEYAAQCLGDAAITSAMPTVSDDVPLRARRSGENNSDA